MRPSSVVATAVLSFVVAACSAGSTRDASQTQTEPLAGWGTECIGRFAVGVPATWTAPSSKPRFVPDGRSSYVVRHPLAPAEEMSGYVSVATLDFLESDTLSGAERFALEFAGPAKGHFTTLKMTLQTGSADPGLVETGSLQIQNSFLWRGLEVFDFGAFVAQDSRARLIHGYMGDRQVDSNNGSVAKAKGMVETLWPRYRIRQTGNIPTGPGICTPHGFFADPMGATERNYRIALPIIDPKQPRLFMSLEIETLKEAPEASRIEDLPTPWEREKARAQHESDNCKNKKTGTASRGFDCVFTGARQIKGHEPVEYVTLGDGQKAQLTVSYLQDSSYEVRIQTLGEQGSATRPRILIVASPLDGGENSPLKRFPRPRAEEAVRTAKALATTVRLRDGAINTTAPVLDTLAAWR